MALHHALRAQLFPYLNEGQPSAPMMPKVQLPMVDDRIPKAPQSRAEQVISPDAVAAEYVSQPMQGEPLDDRRALYDSGSIERAAMDAPLMQNAPGEIEEDIDTTQLTAIGEASAKGERYVPPPVQPEPQLELSGNPADSVTGAESSRPVPVDYAEQEKLLEQQGRMALLAPKESDAPLTDKQKKQREKEEKRPKFAPDPSKTPEENAYAKAVFDAENPVNQDHGVKGFIKELLSNFFEGLSKTQPGMGWKEALALGGTGAGLGIANRSWNERRGAEQRLPRARENLRVASSERQAKATRENMARDDELRKLQIGNIQQGKKDTIKSQTLNNIFKGKYFDPKNPAHAQLAQNAGLNPAELQGWDDRKRDTKQVAGIWYKEKVPNSGIFEPTNLPIDETKTLVEYTVEMPPDDLGRTEKRTYRVSQKDAANFSTQMATLGARLAATADENRKDHDFQLKKQEIGNELKKDIADYEANLKTRSLQETEAAKKRILRLQKKLAGEEDSEDNDLNAAPGIGDIQP